MYQVVVGTGATLSVVGASGADRYSGNRGNHGGAGGVIQIISSSGLISSGPTMKLQKGNETCERIKSEISGNGFLLIKGIYNISAINVAFISGRAKHRQPAPPYEVVLSGTTPGKLVTS